MKVVLSFKTPDVIDDAINDAELSNSGAKVVRKLCEKFVEYGEYVSIEFDTDLQTAKVLMV